MDSNRQKPLTMGKNNNNNNNKKSLNEDQTGKNVMRTIRKSCTKAKTRRGGRTKTESAITRTTSLPMARTTSSTSHSSANTGTDTEGTNEDRLEICVSPQDTSILAGTSPKKRGFVKNKNIPGIKSRLGWSPSRFDDRISTHNVNRHGQRFREFPLRHEYITRADIDMIENLNRNTYFFDVNEDDLAQSRSITLKMLNNLEIIYRKVRRGNRFSHYPNISRNVQRNFRV